MGNIILNEGEKLFCERRKATFRKEEYEYIHTGIIDRDGQMWTTTEQDEANINQIYNQYRVKHGTPFPEEIIHLRKYYGLSAAKMSEILGFGINQYRYYESGEVPSDSNARIIMAIRDKNTFIGFLESAKILLGEREYSKIKDKVERLDPMPLRTTTPSSANGYIAFNSAKTREIVLYYIDKMGGVFVTKMNKLLFYTDFLSYRRRGYGMTGLTYKAMQFGPVPSNWGKVYDSLSDIDMNESILPNQSCGIKLESRIKTDNKLLTESDCRILKDVCERFANKTASEISIESHQEQGWLDNAPQKGIIDYSYAFSLSMV